jgi:hypothetical protein
LMPKSEFVSRAWAAVGGASSTWNRFSATGGSAARAQGMTVNIKETAAMLRAVGMDADWQDDDANTSFFAGQVVRSQNDHARRSAHHLSVSGSSRSAAGPRPQRLDGFTALGDFLAILARPACCGQGPAALHQQLGTHAPTASRVFVMAGMWLSMVQSSP